jgi:hypothetical protein
VRVGKYLQSQAEGDQIEFFATLDEDWFALYPAEKEAGVPSRDLGEELTAEQTQSLGAALEKKKAVSGVFYFALAPRWVASSTCRGVHGRGARKFLARTRKWTRTCIFRFKISRG